VYTCAEAIRIVGILLQPYMPAKSKTLLDMIGVEDSKRTFNDAQVGADATYGIPSVPLGKCAYDSLFPPLAVET
jgi:methionyl-tRNA synthetase